MDLVAQFAAIDTVLSLHYASSITAPKVHEICSQATAICGKRVETSALEAILGYWPDAYLILSYGPDAYDYYITVPSDVAVAKFGAQLPRRKRTFADLVDISGNNPDPRLLSSVAVLSVSRSPQKMLNPAPFRSNSSSPNTSPTKGKVAKAALLKNDASKFLFKEKIAEVEKSKALGLSILERIRLKEKLNLAKEPPEVRYQAQIDAKMPAVYDVLYELSQTLHPGPLFRSFDLQKVVSIVKDSFEFDIAETEVIDVLRSLESRLEGKIQIIKRGDVLAVKVHPLDRGTDLALIKHV